MTDCATGALNSVVFWETKTFLRRKSAQPFPKGCQLASLSWSSTNPSKLAVVPKWGDRIAICDFHDAIMTWSFLLHKDGGSFTCGSLMHNSRYLVSGCANSTVLIWDLKNKNVLKTFQGHRSTVTCIARSSNDHLLVSGSQDGTVLMHTVSSSAAQQMVNLTKDTPLKQVVNRVAFSHMEKSHFGSVCDDGVVCLWSVESQRLLAKFTPPHTSPATDVCFSPNNKMLMISVGLDAKIKCYDIQTRKTVTEITAPAPLSSVALLTDGSTLVGGGADGKLFVYELRQVKTPREVVEAHQSAVTCITQQHSTKSSSRRSSTKSSKAHSKDHPPSPSKTSSVLVSSPEKPSVKDDPTSETSSSSSSATVAPTVPQSAKAGDHESHDSRSQQVHVNAQRKVDAPLVVDRASHIQPIALPETVTPFVTTQHQGGVGGGGGGKDVAKKKGGEVPAGLSIHTPFGASSKQLQQQNKPSEGLPYAMATPANLQGRTSSIFSPLDAQLVTPVHKVTAAIPPTLRTTPLETAASVPVAAHMITPSVSSVQPGGVVSGGGGIFSPLDSGLHSHSSFSQFGATVTPGMGVGVGGGVSAVAQGKLDTSLNLSAMGPPRHHHPPFSSSASSLSGLTSSSRFPSQSSQERLLSQPTPAHPLEVMKSSVKDHEQDDRVSTEQSSTTQPPPHHLTVRDSHLHPLSSSHLPPPPPPPASASSAQLPLSHFPKEDSNDSSSKLLPTPLSHKAELEVVLSPEVQLPALTATHSLPSPPLESGAAAASGGGGGGGSGAAVLPAAPGIQMKFMENMIKDSQEELWYSVHKDIRALSVDIFRQFFAMQQQSAAQFAALNEKVERLSEENKRLQEMVYQYMPKH